MAFLPFGIFSAAGAGVATDFEFITTATIGTAVGTVSFTGLGSYAADYKNLQIRYAARSNSSLQRLDLRFNTLATSIYATHEIEGTGGSGSSGSTFSNTQLQFNQGIAASNGASRYVSGYIDILDPYSTTKNKTVRAFYGGDDNSVGSVYMSSGLIISTAAVTSLDFRTQSTNLFGVDSRFSLYGIRG